MLPRSRRLRIGLAGAVVLGAVALGVYIYERNRTGNIYHPHARFLAQPATKLPSGADRFLGIASPDLKTARKKPLR